MQRGQNQGITYEIIIEQWFQENTRLDQFHFCFYFINLNFQQLISHIPVYFNFSFAKLTMYIFLLLLCVWLHWKFHYTSIISSSQLD